jgi:hypothetical protein
MQRLELEGKAFNFVSLEEDITLLMMEELVILMPDFPWNRITAAKLWIVGARESNSIISFFHRHPTISRLQYEEWDEGDEFGDIAKILVNLESLDTGVSLIMLCRPLDSNSPLLPLNKL